MESRWYVPPGQHVSTTKIADRQLALHIADKSWKSIIKHLDRKRVIQEEIEAREAHRKAMKEGSESMTKNWSNSVEQVRKVKEENLRRKKEREEEDRMNNYMMLKKEQQEIRDEFLAKMRKKMIMRKQHPRNLNTALIASNVQKTREKQIEFAQMMRDHDMAEEDKYAAKVKREAQEEVVENKEKAERIRKKNVEMRDLYLKEIREHKEALAEARRKRIEEEAVDIQKGIEEYEKIQTVRKEEVHEQKMKNREVYAKFFEQKQQLKRIEEQEQREREQIIDIIKASEHRMMCLTLQRKRELHEQALLRQKKAAELLVANLGTTEEEDERILQRALAEQDEAEKRKQEEIRLHKKKVDEDMKAYREQLKQNAAEAKEEEEEMYKWEMLNRFKQDDVIKQHEKDLLEARRNQIMNYRKEILDQIDEDREKQRKEKEEMDYAIIPWDEEDREFFAYADEVVETVKKRGQSTYPVERAIHEYKKFNSLLEKPKDKASKTNPNLLNTTPGKMAHHPDSDPTYRRLKKQEKEKECKKCCDSLQKPADEVCKPSNEKKQTQ